MRACGKTGEAGDHPSGVISPPWCKQPGEGGHEIHPSVVLDARCQVLDVGGGLDQPEVVTQPLHCGAGDRHRALQRVLGWHAFDLIGNGGQHPVARRHRFIPGVEQHEAAGPIRVLGLARVEAGLPEQCRLLIAEDPGQRGVAKSIGCDDPRRRHDRRQKPCGYREGIEQLGRPIQRGEIHQHGSAGIGDIGHVLAGEMPRHPGVHSSKSELARLGTCP